MSERKEISVCMLAYNHSPYIAQAIESVLMQEVEADVKIIIGNDNSTDNTAEIVNHYFGMYPDKIVFIDRKQNIGMMNNFIDVLSNCKGGFVAICEGDDYWTDKNKLQTQLNALCNNNKAIISFTDLSVITDNDYSNLKDYYAKRIKSKFELKDLYVSNPIATCTVMFKNILEDNILNNLKNYLIGDWPLFLLLLNKSNGIAIFLPKKTSIYRKHFLGSFSTLKVIEKLKINCNVYEELLKINSFNKDNRIIKRNFSKYNYAIGIREHTKSTRYYYFDKSIKELSFFNIQYPLKSLLKKVLNSYF